MNKYFFSNYFCADNFFFCNRHRIFFIFIFLSEQIMARLPRRTVGGALDTRNP